MFCQTAVSMVKNELSIIRVQWQSCFCLLGKLAKLSHQLASCYRHKRCSCVSGAILIQICLLTLCNVFKEVLVKAFFPFSKSIQYPGCQKYSQMIFGLKLSLFFCLYAFSISTFKSFLSVGLPLSSLPALFSFSHSSPALKVIDSAIYQRKCLCKKKTWRVGRDLEGLFIHIQWQKVC